MELLYYYDLISIHLSCSKYVDHDLNVCAERA